MTDQSVLPVLPPLYQTVVLLIEQEFNQNGAVPGVDWLAERMDIPQDRVQAMFDEPKEHQFWQVLERKYLAKYYQPQPVSLLSADQMLVLDTLLDPHDKSSMMQKLRRCRKTSAWLQAQLKDPMFAKELDQRSRSNFRNQAYRVREAIANAAAGGDVKAATLYMELIGEYTRSTNVAHSGTIGIESNRVVSLLVEVIQRHVEPDKFEAIARDFEAVLSGKPLPVASIPPVGSLTTPAGPAEIHTNSQPMTQQEKLRALVMEEVPEAIKLFDGFEGDDDT